MATKKHRTVYFNMDDPNDAALQKYIDNLGVKFSGYVKGLIFQDQLNRIQGGPVNPYQISQPYMGFEGVPKPVTKQNTYIPPTPKQDPVIESDGDDLPPVKENEFKVDEPNTVQNDGEVEGESIEASTGQDAQIENFLRSSGRRRRK